MLTLSTAGTASDSESKYGTRSRMKGSPVISDKTEASQKGAYYTIPQ